MFAIILNLKIDAAIFAQRRQYRRDKAVAPAAYRSFFAIQRDLADEEAIAASVGGLAFLIIDQREGLVRRQAIMALERRPDVGGCQFAAGLVGKILDNPAEIRLHPLGEFEALVLLQDPCDAALAGLAVDADHCLDRKSTRL